jgi:hypothetical protein
MMEDLDPENARAIIDPALKLRKSLGAALCQIIGLEQLSTARRFSDVVEPGFKMLFEDCRFASSLLYSL